MTRSLEPREVCPVCEVSALFMVDKKIDGVWVEVKACRDAFCEYNDMSQYEKDEARRIHDEIEEGRRIYG